MQSQSNLLRKASLPASIDLAFQTHLEQTETSFDYAPSEDSCSWYKHVNFSDPTLFIAYLGGLFAQDEIQAAEHPILGHLKEYLSATYKKPGMDHARPMTKDGDLATPILIQGANRHCHVQIDRNAAEGRPKGLYGNQFKAATQDAIKQATIVFPSPQPTNLICMASLKNSSGSYTTEQIKYLFACALASFCAASCESSHLSLPATIHTGNWGCGAFGGNLELTAIIQIAAARAAKTKLLVYHTFDEKGTVAYQKAVLKFNETFDVSQPTETSKFIETLVDLNYRWGEGNGT